MFQLYIKSNAVNKNILPDTKFFLLKKFCLSFAVIKFLPCSCVIYQQHLGLSSVLSLIVIKLNKSNLFLWCSQVLLLVWSLKLVHHLPKNRNTSKEIMDPETKEANDQSIHIWSHYDGYSPLGSLDLWQKKWCFC